VLTPPKDYVPASVEEVNVTADLNGTSANVTAKSSESIVSLNRLNRVLPDGRRQLFFFSNKKEIH
jgi:hypothetical protein